MDPERADSVLRSATTCGAFACSVNVPVPPLGEQISIPGPGVDPGPAAWLTLPVSNNCRAGPDSSSGTRSVRMGSRLLRRSWLMPGTDGVNITGHTGDLYDEILTPEALGLIAALQRELGSRRAELLAARERKQAEIIAGGTFDFLPETAQIREDTAWQGAPQIGRAHV